MAQNENALLVDYQYCTGCHSCEVACRKRFDLPVGKFGIELTEVGPWKVDEDPDHTVWEHAYLPVPTQLCDLCADRTVQGIKPSCVVVCQALALEFGPVEEMARRAKEIRDGEPNGRVAIYLQ